MTSSMISGERRWASARRSGMTILGKVAVPKPINLPSQRLENHGLDPNLEIVPKGTLSWGSKSSSSTNAWGSSTLSPNNDGGSSSPSNLTARPSSGGSGTRPSTAGSDRTHEPANVWGSNSRPSSASGALASNQTSLASLRPRSAETRPGSSQLSRFAEAVPENSGAWSASGTAEKLGITSSKNDGFSLTSGDFPTLGSEKDTSGKNAELQERGSQSRPGSSSGVASTKERTGTSIVVDISVNANLKSGNTNSWRRDISPYSEDGVRPRMEKWHADPQGPHPYPNTGIPLHHYEAWHGPPINNHPGRVWYRGPPSGPPYGPPVARGAFPLEPFPYYQPQIPGSTLFNPQQVPPPGAGPRGPHPRNGDMYRGPMPDAFARPGMPIRPAFYPGPVPVAYEGCYGPPVGYRNSNERDIPYMGIPAGPSAHNRYPCQNALDPGGSDARPSGYGPLGKALAAEHLESGLPHDTRGSYKVLLKPHDGWEGKEEEHRSEDNATASVEKSDQERTSSWESDWKADQRKEGEVNIRTVVEEAATQIIDHQGGDSILGKVKPSEGVKNAKAYGEIAAKKMDHPEVPATKDSSLIQKIEGLNAKARASDGRYESISVCSRKEQENKSHVVNAKAKHFANEVATGSHAVFPDRAPASGMTGPTSNEVHVLAGDKSLDLPAVAGACINRRSTHSVHGRTHHRGQGRFNSQDVDGWQKKPPFSDSSNVKSTSHSENPSDANLQDYMSLEASEKSGSYPQARDEGESMPPLHDPSDSQAHRAMMRELAKQRVKQRQKEEEERARDQKTKALAKLEELNRRTQTAEGITQKLESVPGSDMQNKQEESQTLAEETILSSRSEVTSLISNPTVVSDAGQSSIGELEKPTVLSNQQPLVSTKTVHKATADTHNHSFLLQQRVQNADAALHNHPQVRDGSSSKQKRMGYKKKDYNSLDKSSSEKYISASTTELPNTHTDAAVDVASSAEAVINEISSISESISTQNVVNEPSMYQKRKTNRSGKNKHKVEEALSMAPLPSGISKETNLTTSSIEGSKPKSSECELDPSSFQSLADLKGGNRSSEQDSAFPNEEADGRVNNQWKPQHSQRMRNPQAHRSAVHSGDAVVWAPVRSHNKAQVVEEVSRKSVVEAIAPQAKNDAQVQNNPRNKRAEMERYIPKPVAKEMAQQVISQQPVAPSDSQTAADEIVERTDSGSHGVECSQPAGTAMGKVGHTTESRNDGRQSRQGRGNRSWRQRAPAEANLQGLQDGHYSNPSKNAQKSTEQNQHQKPDVRLVKEQAKCDEWNTSDGWYIPENPDSAVPPLVPVVRDQRMTDRGKRHAFNGHKGGGNHYDFDPKKINNGEADKLNPQSSVPEMVLSDSPAVSKENRCAGDRSTSHWQLKSSAISQRGSRPDSDQNVGAEIGRTDKKDSAQGRVSYPSQPNKEISKVMTQPRKDQYISEKTSVEEAHNVGYQDTKRERKVVSLKGHPPSPNQSLGLPVEAPPSHVDTRIEQRSTAGFRKNGNQNNRSGRGHELCGDWGSSGQETKQHNPPANRERQRHNSHFEYQPVGPQNNSRANNPGGPEDGSHSMGARFRERGQSHPRRSGGNFHGRLSGTVSVDGIHD